MVDEGSVYFFLHISLLGSGESWVCMTNTIRKEKKGKMILSENSKRDFRYTKKILTLSKITSYIGNLFLL
ncbi:hypothetical protein SAMN02910340_02373 [Methanosarcina thermophila]|uniref:Uncharacterized protein n=2 Tax=Methanosarcina thermophila TaxID=2210 RepID=A0A1I7AUE2_METTE|nr:hypothetical protein MSTHT_1317 [Methanosarcina thermophila TM-1]SFT78553.1 hypothetical protein SAMN02910340_02373 [Methanosarcina thermophila]